jgi:hypothetical protein
MVARGHVKNGVIVLDDGVRLPEGQKVTVVTAALALQFRAAWMRKQHAWMTARRSTWPTNWSNCITRIC